MPLPRGFGQKLKEFRASGLSPGDAMRRTWAHFRRKGGNGRERMLDVQRKRAATRRGNPWDTYAGGTAALPGKYSYVLDFAHGRYDIEPPTPSHRAYRLHFVNTKGAKGGGLWQQIGDFRSPQAAKAAAKKHAQQWFTFKLNPGAAWHEDQERMAEAMEKRETRPRQRTYLRGMADAHTLSAHESRKIGLNPRPSAIPAHKLAVANRYVNLLRNKKKRDYGFAYLAWLKGGAVGEGPRSRGPGLSVMAAQAVRMELDAMKLWENPRRRSRAQRTRGNPSSAYDVFLRGKKIDTVFQSDPSSAEEVKRSLVDHDGYDPDIRVVKQRKKQPGKNPIAVYNPPPGRIIYGQVLAVHARKTNGTHRGKNFRHTFAPASRVAMYALPDGSVLLKSGKGLRLWKDIP